MLGFYNTFCYLLLFIGFTFVHLSFQHSGKILSESKEKGAYYANLANELYLQPDSSLYYAQKALDIFEEHELVKPQIEVRCGLSSIYQALDKLYHLEENNRIAYELAIKHLDPNDLVRIQAINNYSIVYSRVKEDYPKALDLLEEAYSQLGDSEDQNLKGSILYNIGSKYFILGDFRTAANYYLQAQQAYEKNADYLHTNIARSCIEYSRAISALNRYEEAETKGLQALHIADTSLEVASSERARYHIHMAETLRHLHKLDSAQYVILPVLEWTDINNDQKLDAWYQYGMIQLAKNDHKHLKECLSLIEKLPSSNSGIKNARYALLKAKEKWWIKDNAQAFHYIDQAILYVCPLYHKKALTDSILQQCLSPYELSQALLLKAKWLASEGTFESLHSSLKIYYQIAQISDFARERFQTKESQLVLLATSKNTYEEALNIIFQIHELRPDEDWLEQANYFIEKSKSALLLNELKDRSVRGQIRLPAKYQKRKYSLSKDLIYNKQQLNKARTESNEDTLQIKSKILDIEYNLDQLEDSIKHYFPVFNKLKTAKAIGVDELRGKLLQDKDVAYNIFFGNEWVYVLSVDKEELMLKRFSQSDFSDEKVTAFLNKLKLDRVEDVHLYKQQAYEWYSKLFSSFSKKSSKKNLIIIPDGPLSLIPFSCLLTDTIGELPSQLSYLIKKYQVQSAYSLSVLAIQQEFSNPNQSLLGVYPLFTNKPYYQPDVEGKLHNLKRFRGTSLVEHFALKDDFLKIAEEYSVLCFATHARSFDSIYQEPAIDFYDIPLYLSELSQISLNAELAILSACETSQGHQKKGEGILSLARGFSYAGVPSLITTIWAVPEGATMNIVTSLLESLNGDITIDKALKSVQLAYLEDELISEAEKAPYYWAGIMSIGKRTQTKLKKRSVGPVYMLIVLSIIGLILLVFSQRDKIATIQLK